MKTTATAKFVGTSSRKVGLVAALVRGQKATQAQAILAAAPQRAGGPVGKVLASAIANAVNNHESKKDQLIIEQILVGPGPTLKRMRPRARGAAGSIKKRTSHITVVLSDSQILEAAKPAPVDKEVAKDQTTLKATALPTTKAKAPAKKEEKK